MTREPETPPQDETVMPIGVQHSLGCRCWPHISFQDWQAAETELAQAIAGYEARLSQREAAAAPGAALDVERMTQAIFDAERPGDWPTWSDYIAAFGSAGVPPWRRKAERLIAEYAALGATPDPRPEPE